MYSKILENRIWPRPDDSNHRFYEGGSKNWKNRITKILTFFLDSVRNRTTSVWELELFAPRPIFIQNPTSLCFLAKRTTWRNIELHSELRTNSYHPWIIVMMKKTEKMKAFGAAFVDSSSALWKRTWCLHLMFLKIVLGTTSKCMMIPTDFLNKIFHLPNRQLNN